MNRASVNAGDWIERAARVGFLSKGIVYILIGFLAGRAASGKGKPGGSSEALQVLLEQPYGRIILYGITIGLAGYMIWRLLDATRDASGRGDDAKGIALRLFTAGKGVAYGLLGYQAFRMTRSGESGGDSSIRDLVSKILDLPGGKFLLYALAIALLGYALYQLTRAWNSKLGRDLSISSLPPESRKGIVAISRFGIAARAVVFVVIGWLLFGAAKHRDAREAESVGGALGAMRDESYGTIILFTMAIGLAAYGVYEIVNAKYRRIHMR